MFAFLLLATLAQTTAPAPAAAPPLLPLTHPKGTVVDRVECLGIPGQSYSLYLPSGYTPDRPWPILYAFDPRAGGSEVAELFRAGAERYGYVVASSNNSASDRPDDPNPESLRAMWRDTHARFALDDKRVYLTGMSGTVRAAIALAHAAPNAVAGVIGAAAGWPFERRPDAGDKFVYYGTTAFGDFNYFEVLDLDEPLSKLGIVHHLEVFEGVHQWMPAEIATRALAWLDLQAMKQGTRAKDPAWIEAQWNEALGRARAFEGSGQLRAAWREYSQTAADFQGLRETGAASEKTRAIAGLPAYQAQLKKFREIETKEKVYLQRAPSILAQISPENGAATAAQIAGGLHVAELRNKAKDASDPEEQWSARRLLATLRGQTGFYLPFDFMMRKLYDRAILALSVAIEIDATNAYPRVERAKAYAKKGDRKRALADLATAAELGWDDAAAIESDEALAPFRGEEDFRRILDRMRQAGRQTGSKPGA